MRLTNLIKSINTWIKSLIEYSNHSETRKREKFESKNKEIDERPHIKATNLTKLVQRIFNV